MGQESKTVTCNQCDLKIVFKDEIDLIKSLQAHQKDCIPCGKCNQCGKPCLGQ